MTLLLAAFLCQTAQEHVDRAVEKAKAGDYEGARVECDMAIARDPRNGMAFYHLGVCRMHLKDPKNAVEDFSKSIELLPDHARSYHDRSIGRKYLGQLKSALTDANRAIELDPGNALFLRERGDLRNDLKDFEGAIADFTKALALDPRDAAAYTSRGVARELRGDAEAALADYEKAIEANDRNTEPYFNRARIFEKREEYARAETELGRLIKLLPTETPAWEERGRVRFLQDNLDGALEDYSRALALNPRSARALYTRGWVQETRGKLDAALTDYEAYLELAPKDPWGYHSRGGIKLTKGDAAGALADADKSIEIKPDFYAGYELRCRIRRLQGEPRKALADAERLIELEPKWANAFTARGTIRKRLWNRDGARSDFSRAIELNPKNLWNTYHQALLNFDERRWPEAVRDLRLCREMPPPSSDYMQIRLWLARAEMGERAEATRELRDYLQKRPGSEWTVRIGFFLTGTLSENELIDAAGPGDARKLEGRLLEARYYAAMRRALDGDRAKAVEYLRQCVASECRTYFEYDSAIFELEALQPGAVALIIPETAEDVFDRIEDKVHLAKSVSLKFTYEARKRGEDKPTLSAKGAVLVKKGNKVLATERILIDGKIVEKKQISDGAVNAFWVGERREDKKTLKNEGAKVLNGILRAGYIQAQLYKVNLIPLDGPLAPLGDPGDFDPRILLRLSDFSFGEEENGARTILHRFQGESELKGKIWYDPKTLTLLKRIIEFPGADGGISVETYTEFVLDTDIPDETFKVPAEKK